VTYEGFAAAWPRMAEQTGEYGAMINGYPKFVVSTILEEPLEWNATLIGENVAEEVSRLKQQPGKDILIFGSASLVNAREEERRRLRRDLHDGLGPQFATLTLKLDAARNLLDREPQAADALLAELKAQTQEAISDIRRLVYDLRPPALDELGLISAIREQAASYVQNGLSVSVEAPESLPPLPL